MSGIFGQPAWPMCIYIQSMAETIHARYCHPSPAPQIDNMYAYGDLFKRCRDLCTDETSFHLALVSLCKRKLAIFTTAGDGEKVVLLASQYELSLIRGKGVHRLRSYNAEGEMRLRFAYMRCILDVGV